MAKYSLSSFYGKIYTNSLFEVLYIHDHLANLWNWITTKILDMFRIITLNQNKFFQSDPVLIRKFSKKLQSDPVLSCQNWRQSWSSPDPCSSLVCSCTRDDRIVDFHYPILSCFWKMISVSDPNPVLVEIILSVSENYPKVYCDAQHTFLCCVYFASWGKITAGAILPLDTIGWSSHTTSLERMSCLVDHDICTSSVPCMDDGCHGFRDGVAVDYIALNYWGKHKRKMAIRGIN